MTEEKEKPKCIEHLEGKSSKIVVDDVQCDFLTNPSNPPKFIIGFAGVGMIGTIITYEVISQLKMKQIGYVLSEDLPPISVFYDGVLKQPFRIYYDSKYNLLVCICEVPFSSGTYTDLARTLMSWALRVGIQDVICVQGLADKRVMLQDVPQPVYAAAEKEILDKITKMGIELPPKGLIMGAEAAILNECLNNKLNGVVFMTPANPQIPSPEGAASVLEKIAEIYNFPISLDNLKAQGTEIRQNLQGLAEHTEAVHQQGLPAPGGDRPLYS